MSENTYVDDLFDELALELVRFLAAEKKAQLFIGRKSSTMQKRVNTKDKNWFKYFFESTKSK